MRSLRECTEAAKQVIVSILALGRKQEPATCSAVEQFGCFYFGSAKLDWEGSFDELLSGGFIRVANECLEIRSDIMEEAKDIWRTRPHFLYWYNDYYDLAMRSEMHSRLCVASYGRDLCQTGMMTISQIDRLVQIIRDNGYHDCLDLGCGSGTVTEYVSDATGARITGMDLSRNGIRQAQERASAKVDRLSFRVESILDHDYGDSKYDIIVSCDTLYFLDWNGIGDLTDRIMRSLRLGGRFVVFYSAWPSKDPELSADGTKLARMLRSRQLDYTCVDLSDEEKQHWVIKYEFLSEHKDDFEREGNAVLFQNRFDEAQYFHDLAVLNTLSRFMYVVPRQ